MSDIYSKESPPSLDDAPVVGSRWRHYKGGTYRVLATSIHEAELVALITYESELKGNRWTRTLTNWRELVDGVPRFTLIPSMSYEQVLAKPRGEP